MVDCSKKKLNITQRKTDTYIKTDRKIMNKRERERERERERDRKGFSCASFIG